MTGKIEETSPLKEGSKRTAEQIELNKKKKAAFKKSVFKSDKWEDLYNKNGLIVSIHLGRESNAAKELFNMIIDAADELKLDYDELNFPFKIIDLKIRCMLFCDLDTWDSELIVNTIFNTIEKSDSQFVKFITRIVPCKVIPAQMDDIVKNCIDLMDIKSKTTFAVDFKSRHSEKFKQHHKNKIQIADKILMHYNGSKQVNKKEYMKMIKEKQAKNKKKSDDKTEKLTDIDDKEEMTIPVLEGQLKVNLTNPDLLVNVEVMKTICCVSILKNYAKYRKYNVSIIASDGFLQ